MKYFLFVVIFFLTTGFNCKKSSKSVDPITWGEETNGLQLSLIAYCQTITDNQPGEIGIIVKNSSSAVIEHDLYAMLQLIDEEKRIYYVSYFNLMSNTMDELYESSKVHPETKLKINSGQMIEFRIDITKLGWVLPIDSRPPHADFSEIVIKSKYKLLFQIELVSDSMVYSNPINIEIKE